MLILLYIITINEILAIEKLFIIYINNQISIRN